MLIAVMISPKGSRVRITDVEPSRKCSTPFLTPLPVSNSVSLLLSEANLVIVSPLVLQSLDTGLKVFNYMRFQAKLKDAACGAYSCAAVCISVVCDLVQNADRSSRG